MIKFIKLSLALITMIGIVSCNGTDDDTSFLNNRTSVSYFVPATTATLFIEEGQNASYEIKIGVSEPKPFERSFVYSIDPSSSAVQGADFTMSSTLIIPANSVVGNIKVVGNFENSVLEGKTVKFNLESVEGSVLGSKIQFSLKLVKSCPYSGLPTLNYSAQVMAFGDDAPSYNVMLQPVSGISNSWTLFSAWGPNFVGFATGDPSYNGQFLYPATLTLNSDFSLTIIGNAGYASGGSGLYSPCEGTFSYTIGNSLFTSPFDTNVILTPM